MDALARLVAARERDLERGRVADVASLVGQEHLVARELAAPVRAELRVALRRGVARHPEQLGEADVVLPQRLALGVREPADEQLVEALRGVGDHGDGPQHQLGVSAEYGVPGGVTPASSGSVPLTRSCIRATGFTNHPARLLRALRYAARMDFKIAPRTEEWFALAIERGLHEQIPPEEVGKELRQLMREDKPVQILKGWESRGLMGAIHPQLAKRHPDYEMLGRILKGRDDLASAGLHPRLAVPVGYATLARLKDRERASLLQHVGFHAAEVEAIAHFESEVQKTAKGLTAHATEDPAEAFNYLEKMPGAHLVFLLAEGKNATVVTKIRNYLHKWRPLRQALPAAILELESLGMPRGPKFDAVIEDFFRAQLHGKAKTPEDRPKILRKLAGIKEPPKKKPEEPEKKKRGEKLSKQVAEKASAKGAPVAAPAAGKPAAKPGKPGHAAAHHPAPPAKGSKPAIAGKKPAARSKS